MSAAAPAVEIPDKLFFRIGEAAKITGVKSYVLRYWETEFGRLKPKRSGSGQRLYRRQDIELVLRIKELLWERKLTIAGARKELSRPRTVPAAPPKTSPGEPAPGPAGRAASADPATARRVDELEGQLRDLKARTGEAEKRAREATARAVLAEKRGGRAERTLQEVAAVSERQRKDLQTVRETLRRLRGSLLGFIDEFEGP